MPANNKMCIFVVSMAERVKTVAAHIAVRISHPLGSFHSLQPPTGARSPITTHILDTARGKTAANVPLSLHRMTGDNWTLINAG